MTGVCEQDISDQLIVSTKFSMNILYNRTIPSFRATRGNILLPSQMDTALQLNVSRHCDHSKSTVL